MTQLAGLLLLAAIIVGALAATGAEPVLAALPFELALIGGSALATLLIANSRVIVVSALAGIWQALRGSRWTRAAHRDLLAVLVALLARLRRDGPVALERELERPGDAPLFRSAPTLLADGRVLRFLTEVARSYTLPGGTRMAGEQVNTLRRRLVGERLRAAQALHTVADALPALGIVAAVLGIIKTMGAIDQPNDVIGAMIATALLGTFLGVFLSYGLVGPLAARFGQVIEEDALALDVIAAAFEAHAQGLSPSLAADAACTPLPPALRPDPAELTQAAERSRFAGRAEPRQVG